MSTMSSTRSIRSASLRSSVARALLTGLLTSGVLTGLALPPEPAVAQQVVYDPRNHIENALQAARQLESLANEATQLANQARMLAASPLRQAGQISSTVQALNEAAREARGIAADVGRMEQQFQELYSGDLGAQDLATLTRTGQERVRVARRTAEDVARLAAQVQSLGDGRSARVQSALAASEGAVGQTAAIQSSNQLMGVLAEDLASLRAVTTAQARLLAESTARDAADREAAAEARRRLWGREPASRVAAPGFDPLSRARR